MISGSRLFKVILVITLFLMTSEVTYAQVYEDLKKEKPEDPDYPYLLPIWGQKAKDKGFELPYSAGIGVNYLWQNSDILISNVAIGFNGGELINVYELIRFNSASAEASGINIRPDVWVLPFINVYGIFARAESNTNVDVSIYISRVSGTEELFSIQTSPQFSSETAGIRLTPTIGFLGGRA